MHVISTAIQPSFHKPQVHSTTLSQHQFKYKNYI